MCGEQTKLTVENMSFSGVVLADFPEYIHTLIQVKEACALANYRAGILEEEVFLEIVKACRKAKELSYAANLPVDVFHGGGGIGINMNINEVLAELTDQKADPVDHINRSQSTSDVCHTALRITLYGMLEDLAGALEDFMAVMQEKVREFGSIQTIARTCWQDGMQIPVDSLWKGVLASAGRSREKLESLKSLMEQVNLGWTVVGTGTGAPDAYREQIIDALRDVTKRNVSWWDSPYDAAQNPDDLARVSTEVSILSALMSKFSRDLRLLCSGPETGLAELTVPPVQKGSSFFPGKVNPVVPEMMIQCNFLVQGNHGVILEALESGEMHLNIWEEMMGFLLMQNIRRLTKAIHLFTEKCIVGVTCNSLVCRQYAMSSIPLVVRYKEVYGYQKASRMIGQMGLEKFLKHCRQQESQTAENK